MSHGRVGLGLGPRSNIPGDHVYDGLGSEMAVFGLREKRPVLELWRPDGQVLFAAPRGESLNSD